MSKLFLNALRLGPAAVALSLLSATGAYAAEGSPVASVDTTQQTLDAIGTLDGGLSVADPVAPAVTMDQVQSVSELSDVQPTDWAFQALQLLIERYGCIAGYPDGTFKGNRALTRYEFAAGVYACLTRMSELLETYTSNLVKKEDLATLRKLQEQFAAELATLRGRVDSIEARTSELEANQFSTTTKLSGTVIFGLAAGSGWDDDFDDDQATFSHRVRLNFNTSFSGRDLLRTRLQTGNTPRYYGAVTNEARLGWEAQNNNQFILDELYYRFPLGKDNKWQVFVGTSGLDLDDVHYTASPVESSDTGALSRFGRYNPIFRQPQGAGAALAYKGDKFRATLSYLAGDAANPEDGAGIFDGAYSAALSAYYSPSKKFDIGVLFAHSYYSGTNSGDRANLTGSTGSLYATRPSVFGNDATTTNNIGVQAQAKISPRFTLAGWAGWTFAESEQNDGSADLFNWAVTFAFPDLFKQGSQGAIVIGQQPYAYNVDGGADEDDPSWHIEALYRFALNDNISLTPGVIVVTDPGGNQDRDTIVVGVLRTTFRF